MFLLTLFYFKYRCLYTDGLGVSGPQDMETIDKKISQFLHINIHIK